MTPPDARVWLRVPAGAADTVRRAIDGAEPALAAYDAAAASARADASALVGAALGGVAAKRPCASRAGPLGAASVGLVDVVGAVSTGAGGVETTPAAGAALVSALAVTSGVGLISSMRPGPQHPFLPPLPPLLPLFRAIVCPLVR